MRLQMTAAVVLALALIAKPAIAVTITNQDGESRHIFVCDNKCGPDFGDDWGSARDFWLSPGESRSFDCSGQCYVGTYTTTTSPTLGDMAFSDDDEHFRGDDTGYIRNGTATHKQN